MLTDPVACEFCADFKNKLNYLLDLCKSSDHAEVPYIPYHTWKLFRDNNITVAMLYLVRDSWFDVYISYNIPESVTDIVLEFMLYDFSLVTTPRRYTENDKEVLDILYVSSRTDLNLPAANIYLREQ